MRSTRWQSTSPVRGCSKAQKVELVAVGHRGLHGGPIYERPVLVDPKVLRISSGMCRSAAASAEQPDADLNVAGAQTGSAAGSTWVNAERQSCHLYTGGERHRPRHRPRGCASGCNIMLNGSCEPAAIEHRRPQI